MRIAIGSVLFACGLVLVLSFAAAQPPGEGTKGPPPGGGKGPPPGGKGGGPGGGGKSATVEEMVGRMMTFDKNQDGKLSKDEMTDSRPMSLFERADADKDGVLTKAELTTCLTKEAAALGAGAGGPGGKGGPPPKKE